MSNELLVKTALRRQEAFKNLAKHLQTIKSTVHKLDPEAEVYMFGSVVTKRHSYSSDIDILVITKLYPAEVYSELWRAGIRDPFEIHARSPEEAAFYRARTKLARV